MTLQHKFVSGLMLIYHQLTNQNINKNVTLFYVNFKPFYDLPSYDYNRVEIFIFYGNFYL